MALTIAINGFGRIGRTFLRTLFFDQRAARNINVAAINIGPSKPENIDLLFKYDSIMKEFPGSVVYENGHLVINNKKIKIIAEKDAQKLPWKGLGIDWVVDASGCFTTRETAQEHIKAGAKKVLITAPATNEDICVVMGINEQSYNSQEHAIVSMGSCTTNCFAPIVKVLKERFNFSHGLMSTVHAYTNDQVLLDVEHKDPRRARAAGLNIVPTKTGAEKVIIKLFPELEGKLLASALRVPVPIVSLIDFTFVAPKNLSVQEINQALQEYAQGELHGIMLYQTKPLVSSDFAGDPHSCIIDSLLTQSCGSMGKVFAWYDNEFGYSSRLKDFLLHIQKNLD
jgi:glyceraldehyde 3-phosphate dehydrogenase